MFGQRDPESAPVDHRSVAPPVEILKMAADLRLIQRLTSGEDPRALGAQLVLRLDDARLGDPLKRYLADLHATSAASNRPPSGVMVLNPESAIQICL